MKAISRNYTQVESALVRTLACFRLSSTPAFMKPAQTLIGEKKMANILVPRCAFETSCFR